MTKTIEEAWREKLSTDLAFVADPNNPSFCDRFIEQTKAVKWAEEYIFSMPLCDRLTKAEKERVRGFYNGDTFGELDFFEIVSCRRVLIAIFGKEMFEKEGE